MTESFTRQAQEMLAAAKDARIPETVQAFAEDLPFADASFDLVACRAAVHHFADVEAGVREMARVAADRVLVVDNLFMGVAAEEAEVLRDPSHVRAMPLTELTALFRDTGFPAPRRTSYRLESELEELLGRSFPKPGDADRIREIFAASLEDDRLGIPLQKDGDRIRYAYPVAVLAADR